MLEPTLTIDAIDIDYMAIGYKAKSDIWLILGRY